MVIALLAYFQETLIFSGRVTQGKPFGIIKPPPYCELVRLQTAGGENIVGLYLPACDADLNPLPDAVSRPTALYFYGNGSSVSYSLKIANALRRRGTNILTVDYPGYGMSGGKASEAGCYAAADAAYDYLTMQRNVAPERLTIAGWSLGGAVAIDLASRRPAHNLATFGTFTQMFDMARYRFPVLPMEAGVLRHKFESDAKIARVACPILLVHGTADTIVPFAMRDRLAAAAGKPVTTLTAEGATHLDLFTRKEVLDAFERSLALTKH